MSMPEFKSILAVTITMRVSEDRARRCRIVSIVSVAAETDAPQKERRQETIAVAYRRAYSSVFVTKRTVETWCGAFFVADVLRCVGIIADSSSSMKRSIH